MIISNQKIQAVARDLGNRLALRFQNNAGLNTVRYAQDSQGGQQLFFSHGGNEAEGQPVVLVYLQQISMVSNDIFGNPELAYTPSLSQVCYELSAGTYTYVVSSANATAGAIYSNNGQQFTVNETIAGGTILFTNGLGTAPLASGTLTKVSGTGDATITYSTFVAAGGGPIPAAADLLTIEWELIPFGIQQQLVQIANGTAVTATSAEATTPTVALDQLYWPTKGN